MKTVIRKMLIIAMIAAMVVPSFGVHAETIDAPMPLVTNKPAATEEAEEEATEENKEQDNSELGKDNAKTDETKKDEATKEEPKKEAAEEPEKKVIVTVAGNAANVSSTKVSYASMKNSLKKYTDKNTDVKGWLYIPNTNINMPIVKPKDNFYYVSRSIEGTNYPDNNYKNYRQTATYTDYRVKLGDTWKSSSRNTVIYGHNWTNLRAPYDIGNVARHTMFAQLPSYNSIDFARKNPYIYFSTEDMEGVWKIFSVAYIEEDINVFGYNSPNPGGEQYEKILKEFKSRSIYNFSTDVNKNDRIITLDTCTRHYNNIGKDQRFVVVARLLRPGETDSDPVVVSTNESVKKPSFVKS